MAQEISISQQAVKARIYKLIDALVEGTKNEHEVQESIMRWWNLVHPQDRAMARKYVLALLEKANASLAAVNDGLMASQSFQQDLQDPVVIKPSKVMRSHTTIN